MQTPPEGTVWRLQTRYGQGAWMTQGQAYTAPSDALRVLKEAREHARWGAINGLPTWEQFTFRVVQITTVVLPD